ncbi:hypothetical protein, partial [Luedemannella flava]|uniref:hypothetical protein n=1 Tax=Luedemannella flava TaxID=349316 RepID=UPI0031E23B02
LVAAACAAATVLATIGLAVRLTAGSRTGRWPAGRDLGDAAEQAAYGLVAAGLLVFIPTAGRLLDEVGAGTPSGLTAVTGGVVLLPLAVSMGFAEWLLYRYRAAAHDALHQRSTLRAFRNWSAGALMVVLAAYLVVVAALSAACAGLTALLSGDVPPADALIAAGALGGAFFLALLLMACGVRHVAVLSGAAALATECLVAALGSRAGYRVDVTALQFAVAAGLTLVLLAYALVVLTRATQHR